MAGNLTRINNNQITDASAGNVYVGVNAASKLQAYSVTSTRLANNLTYNSDFTVVGNLTVNGTTTTVDTVNTLIQDPLITLADGQTSGSPTVDIGFIGLRGSQNSAVFAWQESTDKFVTALSTTTVSNTTFTLSSYADLGTGNLTVNGSTSLVGNLVGAVNATGNITGGNILTPGLISASGTVTGSSLLASVVSASANITGGNVNTGGLITATGNITGGNVLTGGLISATGTITSAGNVNGANVNATSGVRAATGYFTGNVDILGNLNASIGIVYANSGIFYGNTNTGNGAIYGGIPGYTTLGSNVVIQFAGNANSYSQVNFQNISAGNRASTDYIATADNGSDTTYYVDVGINSSTFNDPTNYPGFGPNDSYVHNHGGNLILNPETTGKAINFMVGGTANANVIGYINASGLAITGTISGSGNITGGNVLTGGLVSASGTVTGSSLLASVVSASANITGGNVNTGGLITATGNITGGNVLTGGQVSATGNLSGGNVNTNNIVGTGVTITSTGALNLAPTGNITANSKNITGVADPVQDQDAATKIYVDTVAQGLDPKASVLAATANTLANYSGGTVSYDNGTSGVGATLTTTGTYTTIDGVSVASVGTRVLVKNEANATWNGIYSYTSSTVLTRTADFNQPSEVPSAFTFAEQGTTNADTGWVCTTNGTVVFGTTNINWTQFSGAGSYTAGTGISLNGTVINAIYDNSTIGVNGSNQLYIPANAPLVTPNIGAATGTSLSVTGGVTAASVLGTTVSASANVTGGNILTGGLISAASTITGSSLLGSVVSASANITGGNVLTGGLISASGTVTGSSFLGTVASLSGNVTGGNLNYGSGSVSGTGNIYGGNLIVSNIESVVGNITGGNILTGGLVSATGTVTGSSLLGSVVSASANITGGNILTGGLISAASTITGSSFLGTVASLSGNVTGGNILTGGLVSATGTITSSANITGGNLLTGGLLSATGSVTGGNIVLTGNSIQMLNAGGTITINDNNANTNFAVDGDVNGNVFFVNATTETASFGSSAQTTGAIVAFNSSNSILFPVGNTGQRPATGVTGMTRFNTTSNALEVYDNSQWTTVGVPSFTVIADDTFTGDGSTTVFTLNSSQTTNSCIVSINGILQIPVTAYAVSGTTLTFTEAPQTGDLIDVREITTTTTVTSISNSSGNAVVGTSDTSASVNITGDLLPTSNNSQSLGNATLRWSNLFVSGSTITLGNVVMKNVAGGNTIGFYGPDGTTPATIASTSVDTTTISNGTSNVTVASSNGNIRVNVGGTSNVAVFDSSGLTVTGNLSVTGNATLSGNILGDRVQNGTTSIDIQTVNGNANITVAGTSNVAVFATTGAYVTGVISASGAVTGASVVGGVMTGSSLSVSGGVTAASVSGGVITGSSLSTSGTITGTSHLGSVVSVSGTVTAASTVGGVITGSSASVSGGVTAASVSGGVITGSSASVSGAVTGASLVGTITTASQPNITSVGTLTSLNSGTISSSGTVTGTSFLGSVVSVTGAITGAGLTGTSLTVGTGTITGGNIVNSNANGVGNIGSSSTYFNTVFAKATSAQYADLAEKYVADAEYPAGTVVVFGGDKEVTVTSVDADRAVAGVISTNPSYIMNGGLEAEFVATVALTGRVPCRVTGKINKGDLMVSAGYGLARAEQDPKVGTVIGKALENFEGNEGVIEVVVGRF